MFRFHIHLIDFFVNHIFLCLFYFFYHSLEGCLEDTDNMETEYLKNSYHENKFPNSKHLQNLFLMFNHISLENSEH